MKAPSLPTEDSGPSDQLRPADRYHPQPAPSHTSPSKTDAGLATPRRREIYPGSPDLSSVVAGDGETWEHFAKTLAPDYRAVWRDAVRCYAMLAAGAAAHLWLVTAAGERRGLAAVPLLTLWLGFWFASLMLLVHEAAHFNVHPDKATNDRLANYLLGAVVGEEIARYRAVHWQHHLRLGTLEDTEVSYRRAPTPALLLQTLTGIPILRVLRARTRQAATSGGAERPLPAAYPALVRFAALHGCIVLVMLGFGHWSTALGWLTGLVMGYPFWGSLRKILEHRSFDARLDADYAQVAHGPVNRLFGSDVFSRMFGYAGFNRHLLHHWYPQASYTRFDDYEAFLMRTELAAAVNAARTTYWRAFRQLQSPPSEAGLSRMRVRP